MAHGEALRIRVIKAVVEDGLSRNEAARIFRVGIASAIRWVKAFDETRRTAALPTGGDRLLPGRAQFRYRDRSKVGLSIERAYAASASYLAALAAR